MFSFDNTHIFTGYLKQLLSSINLPVCKIYTSDFLAYRVKNREEDPRIIESFGTLGGNRLFSNVNYLVNNEISNLCYNFTDKTVTWKKADNNFYYDKDKSIKGFTKTLKSLGPTYDTKTHEYLGDFLRFLRDYYNINLMSLYNCFNNKIYNNIDFSISAETNSENYLKKSIIFNSNDPRFKIYAFPVKLFSTYTIAIDCHQGIELFCGLYNTSLDLSSRGTNLIQKTYQKVDKTMFKQPFIYDKLTCNYWTRKRELKLNEKGVMALEDINTISRCDLINREQDLKLFIKVPATCTSSITVLEGDFRGYNDFKYIPSKQNKSWEYKLNHTIINFDNKNDLNSTYCFKPISRLQLLSFNTGESYPFADRLVEYLTGSAILPIDGIKDNIKRAQKVMNQNNHYFRINGLWENQMQKIIYDYIVNAGPIEFDSKTKKLIDRRCGYNRLVGHKTKSNLYDILGYVDKDAEKYYASWKIMEKDKNTKVAQIIDNIQNVDIYEGLYNV